MRLAMDIQRYLNNEAVSRLPPAAPHRLQNWCAGTKWYRLGAAITLVLICGLAVSTWVVSPVNGKAQTRRGRWSGSTIACVRVAERGLHTEVELRRRAEAREKNHSNATTGPVNWRRRM